MIGDGGTKARRRGLAVTAAALAGTTATQAVWATARAATSPAATSPAATSPAATSPAPTPGDSVPVSLASEAELAMSRLPTNLAAPHPGIPEALSHPAADHPTAGTSAGSGLPSLPGEEQEGMDVSSYQGDVNWPAAAAQGATFAYVKATEGTYYIDRAFFAQQYDGSYAAGLERGAYHFAIPDNSTGAAQADFFVAHGGGWTRDNRTLPGMLDIEYNPYGPECYGLDPAQMVHWIASFGAEYHYLTGRYPVVYTTTNWWATCTGNAASLGSYPLAIADYGPSPYPLPASWADYDIWQYSDRGRLPGDQDLFRGSRVDLYAFAAGIGA